MWGHLEGRAQEVAALDVLFDLLLAGALGSARGLLEVLVEHVDHGVDADAGDVLEDEGVELLRGLISVVEAEPALGLGHRAWEREGVFGHIYRR